MPTLPLPLAHMLEEEYVRLYGADEVPLDRRWTVREDEILNARELARHLAERLGENAPPNVAKWQNATTHDPGYRKAVADEINVLLTRLVPKQWLFDDDAFRDAKKAPYDNLADAEEFDPDSVFNLNREMFDALFSDWLRRAADMRFRDIVARIHARARSGQLRTALSISGGGIRSATFALGVMQGLARTHILEKFDYVSTVSGGGYIGSWLSSWVRRNPWGIRGVAAELSAPPADPLDPEAPPVRHLRTFSNYLTPRLGILSADTWALIATYIRNLLLNWVVLIPLLAGVLAVPRYVFTAVVRDPQGSNEFASRGAVAAAIVGVVLLLFALAVMVSYRPVTDSEKTKRFNDGKFVLLCLLPFLGSSVALTLAWAWYITASPPGTTLGAWWFIVPSIAACFAAFLVFLAQFFGSSFVERHANLDAGRTVGRVLAELLGSVSAGVLGGVLIWIAATKIFAVPVQTVASVGAVRWPINDAGALNAVTAQYVVLGVPLLLAILFLQSAVFVGAASHYNHDFDREWWARTSGWVLLTALLWIALSAITIYGPVAIYHLPFLIAAVGGGSGIFSILAGRSGKTSAGSKGKSDESSSSMAMNFALALAVPVFVVFILALISTGTTAALRAAMNFPAISDEQIESESRLAEHATREYPATVGAQPARVKETPVATRERLRSVEHLQIVQTADPIWMLGIVFGCPLLALLLSRVIGVNVFSMHAMYRNRLVRAYLGASRVHRQPNGLTGFDPKDNLGMHELRSEYIWAYSFRDADRAIASLTGATAPQLKFLSRQIHDTLGIDARRVFSRTTKATVRRAAIYQTLNQLIATVDLPVLFDPNTKPASPPLRPLRNRRFVEQAFGDTEVYASSMPLLCAHDVNVSEAEFFDAFAEGKSPAVDALRAKFRHRHTTFAALLAEINDVISTGALDTVPPFSTLKIDTTPFVIDNFPVHRMVANRLRIDAAFPNLLTPLRLARPLHVVNICLNLTSGEELAWQERKGASFTVTPLSSG
ncbi:MAG TPA: patatin-like phospholipase family protein, partial [Thermoanaerobaculia bacterium]|nr:patatin-like phospholipase family protein [Thermoanaerobaculia bacterium]